MKIHRSVYNYRKCQDDRSSLDDVTDFDKILGKPVGRRRAMERTVHNAQTVLAEVLEAVDGLEHEQVRWELQDAFTDFFGKPFNEERWKRVHGTLSAPQCIRMLTVDQRNSSAWPRSPIILMLSTS